MPLNKAKALNQIKNGEEETLLFLKTSCQSINEQSSKMDDLINYMWKKTNEINNLKQEQKDKPNDR